MLILRIYQKLTIILMNSKKEFLNGAKIAYETIITDFSDTII